MGRLGKILICLVILASAGCASTPIPTARLPVPPSEKIRSEWGTIAVVGTTNFPGLVWQNTAGKGAGSAAAAWNGAAYTTAALAQGGNGYGVLLGLMISPATALIGAGVGAIKAEPAAVVKQHCAVLEQAVATINWPVVLRDKLVERARAQTNLTLHVGDIGDAAETVLEIGVTDLGLLSPVAANPELQFVMAVETKLRRTSDQGILYESRLTYSGGAYRLAEWARNDGLLWRQSAERALNTIANRAAEEIFFLYLMKESRQ